MKYTRGTFTLYFISCLAISLVNLREAHSQSDVKKSITNLFTSRKTKTREHLTELDQKLGVHLANKDKYKQLFHDASEKGNYADADLYRAAHQGETHTIQVMKNNLAADKNTTHYLKDSPPTEFKNIQRVLRTYIEPL